MRRCPTLQIVPSHNFLDTLLCLLEQDGGMAAATEAGTRFIYDCRDAKEGRKEERHHLYGSYYSTAAVVNRFVSGRGLFLGGSFLPLHPSPPSLSVSPSLLLCV